MITNFSESTLYLVSAGDIPLDVFSDPEKASEFASLSPVRKVEALVRVCDIQQGKNRIIDRAKYHATEVRGKVPQISWSLLMLARDIERFIQAW